MQNYTYQDLFRHFRKNVLSETYDDFDWELQLCPPPCKNGRSPVKHVAEASMTTQNHQILLSCHVLPW